MNNSGSAFIISSPFKESSSLINVGINEDFTKMNKEGKLYISQYLHSSFISSLSNYISKSLSKEKNNDYSINRIIQINKEILNKFKTILNNSRNSPNSLDDEINYINTNEVSH